MDSLENGGKRTPLYGWHLTHGASMEPFGGYLMPLWYRTGARNEHLSVVTHAGIFDTSHMGIVAVTGTGAHDLLQWCFTRDLDVLSGPDGAPFADGELAYGAFLDERGWCIDDAVVYRVSPTRFMVVVNASMGKSIAAHLMGSAQRTDAQITDLTGRVGKIDIQGPSSPRVLTSVLKDPGGLLEGIRFFTFIGRFDPAEPEAGRVMLKDGTPILLSRSGYTGEIGFELFVSADNVVKLWETLVEAGRRCGLTPCGLAARDSLRTGAGLPLSRQDIGPWSFVNHPWPFTLPYSGGGPEFTKDFLGADALGNCACTEHTLPFVGMDPRKVDPHGAEVTAGDGRLIGRVLSCVTDMAIDRRGDRVYSIASPDKPYDFRPRGLSCGFVKVSEKLKPGTMVIIKNGNRSIPVEITRTIRPDRTARKPVRKFLELPPCAAAA